MAHVLFAALVTLPKPLKAVRDGSSCSGACKGSALSLAVKDGGSDFEIQCQN